MASQNLLVAQQQHLSGLVELRIGLMLTASRFVAYCAEQLVIEPRTDNFSKEFGEILCRLDV